MDYYQLLGVEPSATTEEVRRAYLQLARDRHPDRFADPREKAESQALLQDLSEAFNVLRDPKRRTAYDQYRSGAAVPPTRGLRVAPTEAIQALEEKAQDHPRDFTLFLDLATLYRELGMDLRADRYLEVAEKIAPNDPRVRMARQAREQER